MYRVFARIVLLLLVTALVSSGIAVSHPGDAPGPPSLLTTVTLKSLQINSQNYGKDRSSLFVGNVRFSGGFPADGIDANAEFLVAADIVHTKHPPIARSMILNDAMGSAFWEPNQQLYEHNECSPREEMWIEGHVIEIDADGWSAFGANVGSGAGGAAAGYIGGNIPGAIVGFAISQIASMDGNDDFGAFFKSPLPENDEFTLRTRSAEGRTELVFDTFTDELIFDIGCATPSPSPSPSVGQKTALVFDPLEDALANLPEIQIEPGNPGGLTTQRFELIRDAGGAVVLGIAETATGLLIDRTRDLEGHNDAVQSFITGRELASVGDIEGAMTFYRMAYERSLSAEEGGQPAEQPSQLPFTLLVAPTMYAIEVGSEVRLGTVALGASSVPEIFVEGAPEGISTEVTPVKDSDSFVTIEVTVARSIEPGRYPLQVAAADGSNQTTATIDLFVGPRSSARECRRKGVTMAGTGTSERIVGGNQANVIASRGGNDRVSSGGGNDIVCGGSGEDRLLGEAGNDRLSGSGGNDYLEGGNGSDVCDGGPGRDTIVAGGPARCERFR